MKLHLLNRSSEVNQSLRVSHNCYPNFLRVWHYHPEFELVLIQQSSGTRFVGDSITKFKEGEVVLIGKNVPHMWLNDEVYFEEENESQAEAIAIHFKEDFLGKDFFNIPEMKVISNLLNLARRGIKFQNVEANLINAIVDLVKFDSTKRIYKIIELLICLSKNQEYEFLSSSSFVSSFHKTENRRLDKIYEFVFENFNNPISSCDVAKIAGMNKSAFSRFFKKTHRKSFTLYLNEIRIGYACKLLIENKESITSIAYMSGFNNISNFNRQFKSVHGVSPSSYLKNYQ
ncbi:AraC family transcriptional regulator [Aurantibacter crassamenti]|uniref:AraC family transcriptional regulator n=1 Tax=Aurantibacter crassamenti TaxID=1837375 RepID=UPI00193951C5|nr:AraC family transcriptional regulator [Aurantibacter crassamenti]MBM1105011.1 AraC family transcriptional regulator [Aurantibacter crassamenti]